MRPALAGYSLQRPCRSRHPGGAMVLIALLLVSGCYETYLVREPLTKEARVPAIRESDGQELVLVGSSLRSDFSGITPPDGIIRMRSARARRLWAIAGGVTVIGGVVAIVGGALLGSSLSACGGIFSSCKTEAQMSARSELFTSGLIVTPVGGFIHGLVGPVLFGVAGHFEREAQEAP